jgi:hypothetical protein
MLEVQNAVVIEVLPRPYFLCNIRRMGIGQRVLMRIPSSETQIQSAYEGKFVIDYDELFVVRPEQCRISTMQERVVIRVSDHRNIAVSLMTVRNEVFESLFRMCTIACH